ncbi:hypothetical protein PVAG01_09164 [Phlyctema vagabunda]|uniref:Protein kinase domain-containing protein n=1 Tax=Phlyctema vagabunda TaxID=108571 RepID=A0ABR4P6M2_9HELO
MASGQTYDLPWNADRKWLQSVKDRGHLKGPWNPVRVLGQGGQGVVGLYEWDPQTPKQYPFDKIAIKQAPYDPGHGKPGLVQEYEMLSLLRPSASVHIVHGLADMVTGMGSYTLPGAVDRGTVQMLILEYCEGGSLYDLVQKRQHQLGRKAEELDEEELWAIFHCLARGLLVMDSGSEDVTQPRRPYHPETVHFDINSQISDWRVLAQNSQVLISKENTLIQARRIGYYRQEQGRHPDRKDLRRPYLHEGWRTFNTTYFRRPNANSRQANLVYGTTSNIWQVGLVMWSLMHLRHRPNWNDDSMITYFWPGGVSEILTADEATVGDRQDKDEAHGRKQSRYSKALRMTIAECLIIQQHRRIPVRELFHRTKKWLDETQHVVRAATAREEGTEHAADVPLPTSASAILQPAPDQASGLERDGIHWTEPRRPPSPVRVVPALRGAIQRHGGSARRRRQHHRAAQVVNRLPRIPRRRMSSGDLDAELNEMIKGVNDLSMQSSSPSDILLVNFYCLSPAISGQLLQKMIRIDNVHPEIPVERSIEVLLAEGG